jgi:hypothetical protein
MPRFWPSDDGRLHVTAPRARPRADAAADGVELKNSAESRRVAIVIAQEPTEALATPYRTAVAPQAWLGCDELVGAALMIALGMIVGHVLVDHR